VLFVYIAAGAKPSFPEEKTVAALAGAKHLKLPPADPLAENLVY
jgi:hypothetical protein